MEERLWAATWPRITPWDLPKSLCLLTTLPSSNQKMFHEGPHKLKSFTVHRNTWWTFLKMWDRMKTTRCSIWVVCPLKAELIQFMWKRTKVWLPFHEYNMKFLMHIFFVPNKSIVNSKYVHCVNCLAYCILSHYELDAGTVKNGYLCQFWILRKAWDFGILNWLSMVEFTKNCTVVVVLKNF